jgi:hypothetical protein
MPMKIWIWSVSQLRARGFCPLFLMMPDMYLNSSSSLEGFGLAVLDRISIASKIFTPGIKVPFACREFYHFPLNPDLTNCPCFGKN